MSIRHLQTNFSAGEILPSASNRIDLPMIQNGVGLMRDAKVLATGGAIRRGGLEFCAQVRFATQQHHEFIFNSEQTYQFLLTDQQLDVYDGFSGALIQTIHPAPWWNALIGQLSLQSWGDFTFVTHPEMAIQQIRRTSATTFVVEPYKWAQETEGSENVFQPYFRFAPENLPILVEAIAGYDSVNGWSHTDTATLQTPTADYFVPAHVGCVLTIGTGQFQITTYHTPRWVDGMLLSQKLTLKLIENPLTIDSFSVRAFVYDPFHAFVVGQGVVLANVVPFNASGVGNYAQLNGHKDVAAVQSGGWYYDFAVAGTPGQEAISVGGGPDVRIWAQKFQTVDWKEQMYSPVRGYPHCVSAYLGRLIFGGGKSTPNRVNFSQVEAPFSFDLGTSLDDEGIAIGLSGRRTPIVRQIVGAKHLQIFTSEGEYYVPRLDNNANITPKNISVLPQSTYGIRIGTRASDADGSTLFISKNARALRQLVFGSNEDGYSAPNLSFVASHLLSQPVSLTVQMEDKDYAEATAYIPNADGTMAVFTMVRAEKVAAWGLWNGNFLTACAIDNRMFFVIRKTIRDIDSMYLVKLNYDRVLDLSQMCVYVGRDGQGWQWQTHLFANQQCSFVVDGVADIGSFTPDSNGLVTIPVRANTLEAGLGFAPEIRTLPPELVLPDGPSVGEMRRVVCATISLEKSYGAAIRSLDMRKTRLLGTKAHKDLGLPADPVDGPVHVYMLGWSDNGAISVTQTSNGPLKLKSINNDLEF